MPERILARSQSTTQPGSVIEQNTAGQAVLRNTSRLLSMTLLFSAVTALGSAALKLPHPGLILTLAGYFGLLFLTSYLRNSAWGLLSIFALTGFLGYTLGPILNLYLATSAGTSIVFTAMAMTGIVFMGLSIYARSRNAVNMLTKGTFLFVGILTAFGLARLRRFDLKSSVSY